MGERERQRCDKAFQRDRGHLADLGIVIVQTSSEGMWAVDEAASFVEPVSLSREDLLVLDALLRPLVSDSSLPYRKDLLMALNKVERSFDGLPPVAVAAEGVASPKALEAVQRAFCKRVPVDVVYRRADGTVTERRICPYGFFSKRGVCFVAAAAVAADGSVEQVAKNYNSSRILRAVPRKGPVYELPDDFDIEDQVGLPFQLGPILGKARFLVPGDREGDLRADSGGKGTFAHDGQGRLVWQAEASSWEDAARWAAAEGLRPLEPPEVVEAWKSLLEGAIAHAG
ncbi:MAG: WYL domain-containing protein [Atopobiaceae bacterium]|jgi:proteasome accessory factor B|nr:WYL domain-containing protein [Atopobiaceae bacterium]